MIAEGSELTFGKILKGIGGFYYVKTPEGEIIECKARGKFRNVSLKPYCGDNVLIDISDGKGTVSEILPRANFFIRPPVANIDAMIIVMSCANPGPDYTFVDKMLAICSASAVDAVVCMTKTDLVNNEKIAAFESVYRLAGCDVYKVCNLDGGGDTDKIRTLLNGRTTAFAGFSGVGKSSLLNNITGEYVMHTGSVSERLGRGKHTTRHVELVDYSGGYVVDTPGFGSLELTNIEPENLKNCFPEFAAYEDKCRFADCMHLGTKWCGVYDAVCDGLIAQSRYDNYKSFYKLLKDKKEW